MEALKKLSGDRLTLNGMAPYQPSFRLLSHGMAATMLYPRYGRFSVCCKIFGRRVCTVLQLNAPCCGLHSPQGMIFAMWARRQ